jgi:hypothetical protein
VTERQEGKTKGRQTGVKNLGRDSGGDRWKEIEGGRHRRRDRQTDRDGQKGRQREDRGEEMYRERQKGWKREEPDGKKQSGKT